MSSSRNIRLFAGLSQVPMPVWAIVTGLICGLVIWMILDAVQNRALREIFQVELSGQLELQAHEARQRFDIQVQHYTATAHLLARHQRLLHYLEPITWTRADRALARVYLEEPPPWLPELAQWSGLVAPSHLVLFDRWGRAREVYQAGAAALPANLVSIRPEQLAEHQSQAHLATSRRGGLLTVSEALTDAFGTELGFLLLVVPIDDAFLATALQGISLQDGMVAVVDGKARRVFSSTAPDRMPAGADLGAFTHDYLVDLRPFFGDEGSALNLEFATLMPRDATEAISLNVLKLERRQRIIAALAFVGVFTLLILAVSERINRVLRRIAIFSQRALGHSQPEIAGGNPLLLLEDRVGQLISSVLAAREEMRRRHESELRETVALRDAILDASLDCIITINAHGNIIETNPAAERALAYAREEMIGQNMSELVLVEADRVRFRELLAACTQRGKDDESGARAELTALRADGNAFPVELVVTPIQLEDRLVYATYLHDISQRRRAESEIKSLAKFPSESPIPVLRVNHKGVIIYANAPSEPLLAYWGCSRGQTLPRFWKEMVSQVVETGRDREVELACEGQLFSLLMAAVAELGYVNIYGRDITAVRIAEEQSRQHQSELVHVCRLSTMGEMATGLAHELNQPLSAIANYASGCNRRLQAGIGDTQALLGALNQIASQAERAGEIIRRLRNLVGRQAPVRGRVDLNELVREVCGFVEFEARKTGVVIEFDLSRRALPVEVDLVQIEQVLLNLIRNALDALQESAPERRRLVIRTRAEGRHEVHVSVQDSGDGIAPEAADRLFDPFYTTKATGMGMGLPISRTIIDDHGGRIWVSSEPGRGTTFHVVLPNQAQLEDQTATRLSITGMR